MTLEEARKKTGLSQAEVGKALGVSSAAVCYWETGKNTPRLKLLYKIADLYGLSLTELLLCIEESGGSLLVEVD